MSLNSVQQYIKDTIDGTTSPYLPICTARVAPPSVDDIGAPKAYVWGSVFHEKRWTNKAGLYDGEINYIAGSGGNKRVDYEVYIYLCVAMPPDDQHADEAFPILIENVMKVLRAVPKVTNIVDPTTAQKSTLMNLGEEFRVEYIPPHTLIDQRYIRMDARITATLFEMISV